MNMDMYAVGGWVRDSLMERDTNDLDFTVVGGTWQQMQEFVAAQCTRIHVVTEEFFTVRGQHPEFGDVDFVWARKDGAYSDGRRPDTVQPGTLHDDLARRDFTVNAMAVHVGNMADFTRECKSGDPRRYVIDPFGGLDHLFTPLGEPKMLHAVGDAEDRMMEDGLRPWRALRFSMTHGFDIGDDILEAMSESDGVWKAAMAVASERVQQEMHKAAKRATFHQIAGVFGDVRFLLWAYALEQNHGVWFQPTLKNK